MSDLLRALNRCDLDLSNRLRLKSTRARGWLPVVILSHSGDSWVWAAGVGLVWLASFAAFSGAPAIHRQAAVFEISIVLQALLVFGLKQMIRRARPAGDWGAIYRQVDPHSFPSGHAVRAALLAVMGLSLGPAWLGWLLALWAPLVCISRVLTGLHYLTDILGGVLLGTALGFAMLALAPVWMNWFPFLF